MPRPQVQGQYPHQITHGGQEHLSCILSILPVSSHLPICLFVRTVALRSLGLLSMVVYTYKSTT